MSRSDGEPSHGPAAVMAERARNLAEHPPKEPWDGVLTLTSE